MRQVRRDNPEVPYAWLTAEGRARICGIIEECVPTWSNGPRSYQIDSWAHTLQKISLVLIASTGSGKTAAFYAPILVMQHLLKNPVEGIPRPPENPVALVVTPLIELGNNHVREMEAIGLKAVSICAESLKVASHEGQNLFEEIRLCQWSIVLLSAVRLASKEFDVIVHNETFRKNLVIYGIDEVHVLIPWSLEFRTAYHQVALLPKRLPDHVALVVAMATLATGRDSDALFLALGLRTGKYHCQHLSTERPNVRTVITELGHGLNGYKFPDVAWVFSTPGIKGVLYCRTLELGFRVAVYGWSLVQEGENPLDCVRLWNSLTSPSYNAKTLHLFETNPHTHVIVATIAFGMGMNLKNITHSINLGIPDTCDALVQQNGRAGRDLESESCGWTYVEPSVMTALGSRISDNTEQEDYREVCSDSEVHVAPSTKNTKGKAKAAKQSKSKPPMQRMTTGGNLDSKLMRLLGAHEQGHCLEATKNAIFGCPGEHAKKRCQEAGRPLPCSSCQPFWNNPSPAPMPTDFSLPPPTPILPNNSQDSARISTAPLPPPLTRDLRDHATQKLWSFADERWAQKDGPRFRLVPDTAFWPLDILHRILNQFHLLRSREWLDALVQDWEFLHDDGDALVELLQKLNKRYDARIQNAKALRAQKAAATRAMNKAKKAQIVMKENIPPSSRLTIRLPAAKLKPSQSSMHTVLAPRPMQVASSSRLQVTPDLHPLSPSLSLSTPTYFMPPLPIPVSSPNWVPPPPYLFSHNLSPTEEPTIPFKHSASLDELQRPNSKRPRHQ